MGMRVWRSGSRRSIALPWKEIAHEPLGYLLHEVHLHLALALCLYFHTVVPVCKSRLPVSRGAASHHPYKANNEDNPHRCSMAVSGRGHARSFALRVTDHRSLSTAYSRPCHGLLKWSLSHFGVDAVASAAKVILYDLQTRFSSFEEWFAGVSLAVGSTRAMNDLVAAEV